MRILFSLILSFVCGISLCQEIHFHNDCLNDTYVEYTVTPINLGHNTITMIVAPGKSESVCLVDGEVYHIQFNYFDENGKVITNIETPDAKYRKSKRIILPDDDRTKIIERKSFMVRVSKYRIVDITNVGCEKIDRA